MSDNVQTEVTNVLSAVGITFHVANKIYKSFDDAKAKVLENLNATQSLNTTSETHSLHEGAVLVRVPTPAHFTHINDPKARLYADLQGCAHYQHPLQLDPPKSGVPQVFVLPFQSNTDDVRYLVAQAFATAPARVTNRNSVSDVDEYISEMLHTAAECALSQLYVNGSDCIWTTSGVRVTHVAATSKHSRAPETSADAAVANLLGLVHPSENVARHSDNEIEWTPASQVFSVGLAALLTLTNNEPDEFKIRRLRRCKHASDLFACVHPDPQQRPSADELFRKHNSVGRMRTFVLLPLQNSFDSAVTFVEHLFSNGSSKSEDKGENNRIVRKGDDRLFRIPLKPAASRREFVRAHVQAYEHLGSAVPRLYATYEVPYRTLDDNINVLIVQEIEALHFADFPVLFDTEWIIVEMLKLAATACAQGFYHGDMKVGNVMHTTSGMRMFDLDTSQFLSEMRSKSYGANRTLENTAPEDIDASGRFTAVLASMHELAIQFFPDTKTPFNNATAPSAAEVVQFYADKHGLSDMFARSQIFVYAMSAISAYENKSAAAVVAGLQSQKVRNLVCRCLHPLPAQRISLQELQKELDNF